MATCLHSRTEFLYRRDGIDYMRCLGCSTVFEAEDLEVLPDLDAEEEEQGVAVAVGSGRRRR